MDEAGRGLDAVEAAGTLLEHAADGRAVAGDDGDVGDEEALELDRAERGGAVAPDLDGARLGAALTCRGNDLSISCLASLCDAYYIGGTKNGALFGEALVIRNGELNDHFRWMMKRQCGLLAKGRLIGVQFEALLEGGEQSLYYEIASRENRIADMLRSGLSGMGITFFSPSTTNQIFPIMEVGVVRALQKDFFFYEWAKESDGMIPIRLVTGWGTTEEDAEAFLDAVRKHI